MEEHKSISKQLSRDPALCGSTLTHSVTLKLVGKLVQPGSVWSHTGVLKQFVWFVKLVLLCMPGPWFQFK